MLRRNRHTGQGQLWGQDARMQSARSCLFCHLKLPKLLRCQNIQSEILKSAAASSQRVEPIVVKTDGF